MFLIAGKETEIEHWPKSDVNHHICRIENVMPIGNLLDIDEIDHAAVQQSVKNIAATTTDYKAEADVFVGLDFAASPQVNNQCADQQQTERTEYPAMTLKHPEYSPHVANVREVDEGTPFHARAQWDVRIYQIAADL